MGKHVGACIAGNMMIPPNLRGPLDMHVHVVGNGRNGSGCWLRLQGYRRFAGEFMLKNIGVGMGLADPQFDEKFGAYVATQVRESSLSHAVILAHEEVYHEDGGRMEFGTFHVSNQHVLNLAATHPELLPAVSIHPARKDACQELERCAAGGAVMVKILPPSQNIDCSRPAYRDFFKLMSELRLPLLSHAGGEYTVPVVSKKWFNPQLLRQPLELGVPVVAAHFATRSAPKLIERDYLPGFLEMLKEYPHLLGDNSALNSPNRSHGLRVCLREEIMRQCVHGSDFPVPVSGRWAAYRGLLPLREAKRLNKISNVLERDYQLKVEMGFQPDVFTRMWDVLRLS
jgi:uncharacterized protein